MLPVKFRLKDQKDFDLNRKNGKFYQLDNFAVSVLRKNIQEVSKFGFIVSNKISKSAVVRNRIKRALKKGVENSLLDFKNGYNMVFLAKISIINNPNPKIVKDVEVFFESLKKENENRI